MKYLIYIIAFFCLITKSYPQDFYIDNGIYFERPKYNDTSKYKYSLDNISYKINSSFVFNYYYLDLDGKQKKFLLTKEKGSKTNPLNLVNPVNNSTNTIDKIKIVIDDPRKQFIQDDSDYTQTVISYNYILKNGKSSDTIWGDYKLKHPELSYADEHTGVVDNIRNLWLHPPRRFSFEILQLNPYPFYVIDENIRSWSWKLVTGGGWLDPRWVKQPNTGEKVVITFEYIRLENEIITIPLGTINCHVVEATGSFIINNTLFETKLKSYYYPKYGFVRLEYLNVNGSKLYFELEEMK